MIFRNVFEETHNLIEKADELLQTLYELTPDPEESYLNTIAYNLNVGHRWLRDLKESTFEDNKKNLEVDLDDVVEKAKKKKEEEEETVIDDLLEELDLEVIEEEITFKEESGTEWDKAYSDLFSHLNKIGDEYNKALYLVIANGFYIHAFMSNLVQQYLKEAVFALEFEKSRLEETND